MRIVMLTVILISAFSCRSTEERFDSNVKESAKLEQVSDVFHCPQGEQSVEDVLAILTEYNHLVQKRYPEGGGKDLLNYSGECSGKVSEGQSGSSNLLKSCVRLQFVEDKTVSYKYSVTQDSHFPGLGFDALAAYALGVEPGSMSPEEQAFANCMATLNIAELRNEPTSLDLRSIHVEGNDGIGEAINSYYGLGIMLKSESTADLSRGIYFLAKAPQR